MLKVEPIHPLVICGFHTAFISVCVHEWTDTVHSKLADKK